MGRAGRAKRHEAAVKMWNREQAVRGWFEDRPAVRVWLAGAFFLAVIMATGIVEGL